MSHPTGGIAASDVNLVHKRNITLAVMAGKGGKLFWFLFFKLSKPCVGLDLPRFTAKDEAELLIKNADVHATETVTFGDIYANKIMSTTTALPHHVFTIWHHGRILIIGDAAHKVSTLLCSTIHD